MRKIEIYEIVGIDRQTISRWKKRINDKNLDIAIKKQNIAIGLEMLPKEEALKILKRDNQKIINDDFFESLGLTKFKHLKELIKKMNETELGLYFNLIIKK